MMTRAVQPSLALGVFLACSMLGALPCAADEAPDVRHARLELAYRRIAEKNWKEAIALIGALLDESPGDARLRMELGYARQAQGDLAAAADEFAMAARVPGEFQAPAAEALKNLEAESREAAARADALTHGGYQDLDREDGAAAREKFARALAADPSRTLVAKQLGYMSVAEGDAAGAATRLEGVRRLDPLDHETALELGFIYDSLHNEAGAEKAFASAAKSPDARVREAAQSALDNVRSRTDPFYFDAEASAYSTSRFANKVAALDLAAGWKPARSVALYFAVRGTQDARSRGGVAPEIYADDAISFAPGIRVQPKHWSASLTAEVGPTVNLLRSEEYPGKTQVDARVILSDYHYWQGPHRLFVDAGANVGYYSRYRHNVIGYAQLRFGIKVWDDHHSQLSLYAPVNGLKDSNRDFYNNEMQYGAGLELQPWTRLNFKVRGEYLRGVYSGIEGRDPNPYGPRYDELRVLVVFSGHFTRRPKPEEFEPTRKRRFIW